jgi:hypothetical protein
MSDAILPSYTWPFSQSLVFLRMEKAMTRPTMSVSDSPAWIDSST